MRRFFILTALVSSLVLFPTTSLSQATSQFTLYSPEPVFTRSESGWDNGGVAVKSVLIVDDTYHLFYDGRADGADRPPAAIGHATSPNGLEWTRSLDRPILTIESVPFGGFEINAGTVLYENNQWVMYFSTIGDRDFNSGKIGRATAMHPDGEWTVSETPVLVEGETWDSRFIFESRTIATENGYIMYYSGFGETRGGLIGRATSSDGVVWVKDTEPIDLSSQSSAWNGGESIQPTVLYSDNGWEMVFMGLNRSFSAASLGYATSSDGIEWELTSVNPIIPNTLVESGQFLNRPQLLAQENGSYWVYFNAIHSDQAKPMSVYLAIQT